MNDSTQETISSQSNLPRMLFWVQVTCQVLIVGISIAIIYAAYQVDLLQAERSQFIRMPMPPELEATIWPNHGTWAFYQSLITNLIPAGLATLGIFLVLAFRKQSRWYQAYVPGFAVMWVVGVLVADRLPIYAMLVLGPLSWPVMSDFGMTALFFIQALGVSTLLWIASRATQPRGKKWLLALFRMGWFFSGVMNIPMLATQTLR